MNKDTTETMEERLAIYLWGKVITRDVEKDAEMIMPFIKEEVVNLLDEIDREWSDSTYSTENYEEFVNLLTQLRKKYLGD